MTQLVNKYVKCSECGKEDFQWGALIRDSFICKICLKHLVEKLDDMEQDAQYRTSIHDGKLHLRD